MLQNSTYTTRAVEAEAFQKSFPTFSSIAATWQSVIKCLDPSHVDICQPTSPVAVLHLATTLLAGVCSLCCKLGRNQIFDNNFHRPCPIARMLSLAYVRESGLVSRCQRQCWCSVSNCFHQALAEETPTTGTDDLCMTSFYRPQRPKATSTVFLPMSVRR